MLRRDLRFKRLIKEDKFDDALSVARQQVENGAQIIGISRSMPAEKNKDIFIEHYGCDFSNLDALNKTIKVIIKKCVL